MTMYVHIHFHILLTSTFLCVFLLRVHFPHAAFVQLVAALLSIACMLLLGQ